MSDGPAIAAIVLAGGVGSRFGDGSPKQLTTLAGYPVLHHTLHRLDSYRAFDHLVVAGNPDWRDEIRDVATHAVQVTSWTYVDGGASRNASVAAAVAALDLPEAKVLVHDSVRPLVTRELVARVTGALDGSRAVLPVIPSVDPLVVVEADGTVSGFDSRQTHMRGQSPQGFWLSDLREAFARDGSAPVDAFSTIYELLLDRLPATTVTTVEGELNNLKITLPIDRVIAGQLLLQQE